MVRFGEDLRYQDENLPIQHRSFVISKNSCGTQLYVDLGLPFQIFQVDDSATFGGVCSESLEQYEPDHSHTFSNLRVKIERRVDLEMVSVNLVENEIWLHTPDAIFNLFSWSEGMETLEFLKIGQTFQSSFRADYLAFRIRIPTTV
jgi:hypothetical protein